MRWRTTLLFALVVVLVLLATTEAGKGKKGKKSRGGKHKGGVTWVDAVQILDSGNWTDKVVMNPEGVWIVDFYSEECQHCQELHPIWEGLAQSIGRLVNIAAVNCDLPDNHMICGIYAPVGLPSIVVFREGVGEEKRPFQYRYERSPRGLIELVMGSVPRVARMLRTHEDLDTWMNSVPLLPRCVYITNIPSLDLRLNAIAYTMKKRIAISQIRTTNTRLSNNFPRNSRNKEEGFVCYAGGVSIADAKDGSVYSEFVTFPNVTNFISAFALQNELEPNMTTSAFYKQLDTNETTSLPYKEMFPSLLRAELEEPKGASLVHFCHRWMPNCEAVREILPSVAEGSPLPLYFVDLDRDQGREVFDRLRLERVPTTAVLPGSSGIPILYDGENEAERIVAWTKKWMHDNDVKVEL